jgi:hypothetical protein
MAREKQDKNVLDMTPSRLHEWEVVEDIVKVQVSRFKSRLGKRFCRWLKKSPTINVNLDKHSSEAWRLCDGQNTVRYIAESLHEKFGDEVEPAYERVAELMGIMELNGLITYKNVKDDS